MTARIGFPRRAQEIRKIVPVQMSGVALQSQPQISRVELEPPGG